MHVCYKWTHIESYVNIMPLQIDQLATIGNSRNRQVSTVAPLQAVCFDSLILLIYESINADCMFILA